MPFTLDQILGPSLAPQSYNELDPAQVPNAHTVSGVVRPAVMVDGQPGAAVVRTSPKAIADNPNTYLVATLGLGILLFAYAVDLIG
jgi:hypothetical protein